MVLIAYAFEAGAYPKVLRMTPVSVLRIYYWKCSWDYYNIVCYIQNKHLLCYRSFRFPCMPLNTILLLKYSSIKPVQPCLSVIHLSVMGITCQLSDSLYQYVYQEWEHCGFLAR